MNSLEILAALDRTDPLVAGFVATRMTLDELSDATDQFMAESGEQIVKALRDRERQFRAEAGGTYVTSVAKSGTPSDRAFTLAAAADQAAFQAEEIEKAFGWENWLLGGKQTQRKVNRDEKGRFTRTLQNATAQPGDSAFAAPGEAPGANQFAMPEQVSNYVAQTQPDGQSQPTTDFKEGVDEEQQQQVERYLGQVKAVQTLVGELKERFKGDMDDLEMNVLVNNPDSQLTNGEEWMDVPMTQEGVTNFFNENVPLTGSAGVVEYMPRQGLSNNEFNQNYADLRLAEMGGVNTPTGETAPDTLAALGAALRGQKSSNYLDPGTKRLKGALDQWSAVMTTLPDKRAQALGQAMQRFGPLAEAADKARPGMLKTSFRFQGTRKKKIDDELLMQVTGSQLTPAEQLAFDVENGLSEDKKQKEISQPTVEENKAVNEINQIIDEKMLAANDIKAGRGNANDYTRLMGEIRALQQEQRKAMSAAGKPRSQKKRQLSTASYGDNWAFNALKNRKSQGQSGLQATMGAQRDAAAYWFIRQMIDQSSDARTGFDLGRRDPGGTIAASDVDRLTRKIAANLGQGFPSEGIMIDRKGNVTQQSIGAGEDHYLPFDLGGYKRLIGGSYVRTRQVGGPTSEDLLALIAGTGLAGTVVSRSGVFEVEMDQNYLSPTKVGRMARMYERVLNDIAHGGHYVNEMDPEALNKEMARRLKMPKYKVPGGDDLLKRDMEAWTYDQRRQQAAEIANSANHEADARKAAQLEFPDMQWERMGEQTRAKFVRQAKTKAKKDAERKLLINGEGYEVALRTLQRYFPYAIKNVERRELADFVESITQDPSDPRGNAAANAAGSLQSGEKDSFRVQPGSIYSNDKNALEPTLKPEDQSGFTVKDRRPGEGGTPSSPVGGGTGGGGSGGTTVPTTTEAGTEGEETTQASETDVTNAPDPESDTVTAAREGMMQNQAQLIANNMKNNSERGDWSTSISSLTDPNVYGAELALLTETDEGSTIDMGDETVGSAKTKMANAQRVLKDTGDETAKIAAAHLIFTGNGYKPLWQDTIRHVSGFEAGGPAARLDLHSKMLSMDGVRNLGAKLTSDSGNQNRLKQALLSQMTQLVAQSDFIYNEPVSASSDSPSADYDGKPLLLPGMEADNLDDGAARKQHGKELIKLVQNSGLPVHANIAQNLQDNGIAGSPYEVVNAVIDTVVETPGAAGSAGFSGAARQAFVRSAADAASAMLVGERPPANAFTDAVMSVAGISTNDPDDVREAKASALADALVADYSLTARANSMEWADSPKVLAGSSPAAPSQPARPAPKTRKEWLEAGKEARKREVKKSDDSWELVMGLRELADHLRS